MSHYKKHVFFCINQRDNNAECCAQCGASELQAYAKQKIKNLKKKWSRKNPYQSGWLSRSM